MFKKLILIVLLLNYCLTQSLAKPTENYDVCQLKAKYAQLNPSEKDNELKPSLKLLKFLLVALQRITLTYVTKVKDVSEEILKDPALKENNSQEVQEFLQKIKEFEEKYATCQDMNELLKIAILYSAASSKYYEMEKENTLNDDMKVILAVLKKYKSKELDDEFENSFLEFIMKYEMKLKEVKDELEEEKLNENTVKWWEEVQKLKSFEERMGALIRYANLL